MSSVGSSDSSNNGKRNDEVVRRQREEYRSAEADTVKKHKKEIRRMSEAHHREIEELKASHAEQLENMNKSSRDTVSKRDHKYQQEMEDLRGMHMKQLKATADENVRKEDALRKAIKGDSNAAQKRNDDRFETLSETYRNDLRKQEELHDDTVRQNRDAQQAAIDGNRQKLERAFDKQLGSVIEDRNEKVGDLQKRYTEYRQYSDDKFKGQEIRHLQDKNRASDQLMRAVRNERDARTDSEEIMRDGFQDGLNRQADRFAKAIKKEKEASEISGAHMKRNAIDRIDNQVRRLENEKMDLKDSNTRQDLKTKHQARQEINNIRDAYGKNIENYKDQRDQAVRDSNERSARDVATVRDQMGKELTETNRFYRGKMAENNRIQRNAYDNLVGDFEARQEYTLNTADQRVKTIHEQAVENEARMIKHQGEAHVQAQRQQQDEMRNLREFMDQEKQDAVMRMQDQMRKQELRHTEKLNTVVQKYEKQIVALKDEVLKERLNGETNLKRTVDELQRAHKLSHDQVEAKNRERMRQVSNQQAEELRSVNKRHEEKLDSVLAEVKKT